MNVNSKISIEFTCDNCGLKQTYEYPDFYHDRIKNYGIDEDRIYIEYQCSKCQKRFCEEVH